MRIISFTEMWDKLSKPEFTTFRFPRKDKDWYVGERVQVFFKNRSPDREFIGIAEIIDKVQEYPTDDNEAQNDGFNDLRDMENWMIRTYGEEATWHPMNKLTLSWRTNNDR